MHVQYTVYCNVNIINTNLKWFSLRPLEEYSLKFNDSVMKRGHRYCDIFIEIDWPYYPAVMKWGAETDAIVVRVVLMIERQTNPKHQARLRSRSTTG